MLSVYRWITEHSGLCRTLLFLLLGAFTLYAASFQYVSFLSIYLLDLFIWFLVGRFISLAPAKLLREPHSQLQQECDPYPLMEETQRQLARKFDGPHRQVLEMDYAVSLRETGQFHKASEVLENINIDKFPGTTPFLKYVYYHNLSDICYLLDRSEEARIWSRKFRQIYHDLPPTKAKQELAATNDLMEAEIHYYEGNFESALRKVAWIKLPTRRMVLDGALLAAKCHIALEEPEKARQKLQYIIDNGNRLFIVQQAREILDGLN
jgi:hypothetical protein